MKQIKLIAALIFILSTCAPKLNAQTTAAEKTIATANDLKSGNHLEVLSSFMQVAFDNLTGEHKAFEFRSSLFALKVKTDPGLRVDTSYLKHSFDRNFQFRMALNLNDNFSPRGFGGGITWAIVNKRDSSVLNLQNTVFNGLNRAFQNALSDAKIAYYESMRLNGEFRSEEHKRKYNEVKAKIDEVLEADEFVPENLPEEIMPFIRSAPEVLQAGRDADMALRDAIVATRKKPLLTLSLNGDYSSTRKTLEKGHASLVYLQGAGINRPIEADVRASVVYTDTVAVLRTQRGEFNFSGGGNFAIIYNKKSKISILEVKPAIQYTQVFTGLLPGEEQHQLYANMELRLRIFKDIWFPVTIKYDVQNQNCLGFLNINYNLDIFKDLL